MIGVGKTKRGRRYPHYPEHFACVLCGREYRDENSAAECFDRHSDETRDLTEVLHHLFCTAKHCRVAHHCIRPTHRSCCDFYEAHECLGEDRRAAADEARTHWTKAAERVKRFAREHGISALTLVKFIHNLKT